MRETKPGAFVSPTPTPREGPETWEQLRAQHPDTPEGRRDFQQKYIIGQTSRMLDAGRAAERKNVAWVPGNIPDPVLDPIPVLKVFVQKSWQLNVALLTVTEIDRALSRAVTSKSHLETAAKTARDRAAKLEPAAKAEAWLTIGEYDLRAMLAEAQADCLRIGKQIKAETERNRK